MNISKAPLFICFLITVIFVSIWIWARAFISIGIIGTILMYLIYNKGIDYVNLKTLLKKHPSFIFLLFSGILYTLNCFYLVFANESLAPLKLIPILSNPLIITLYTFSIIYFLSSNNIYAKYLLNIFCVIISFIAITASILYIWHLLNGQNFLIAYFYSYGDHPGQSQNIVALSFPFAAVLLLNKLISIENFLHKLLLSLLIITIIFADLFLNRSKIGYVIEFIVLIYYCYILIKKYSYTKDEFKLKKLLTILSLCLFCLVGGMYVTYKNSEVFNQRITTAVSGFHKFFDKNHTENNAIEGSVEIRLIYYVNSLRIFKDYPKLLLFGCPINENTINPWECSGKIISSDNQLKKHMRGLTQIPPHNEFINYTYQAGIFSGLSLLIFLILIFYEAKYIDKKYIVPMRVLVMAFFVGCCFEFYMSRQVSIAFFFTLLGIFLSTKNNNQKVLKYESS